MAVDDGDTVDRGYAWVVAVCGTFLMALQASFFSVYGVIFIELVEYYGTTKSVVSWIGAIQQLVFGLSGKIELLLYSLTLSYSMNN